MKWKSLSDISIMTVLIFIHTAIIVGEDSSASVSEAVASDFRRYQRRVSRQAQSSSLDAAAVYSSWSGWSSWSKCSRTCGGGVRSRSRICRRRTGGGRVNHHKSCFGDNTEHEVCNSQQCPANVQDFRAYQCSQYNYGFYLGRHVDEWITHESERNPCELNCEAKGKEKFVYSFGKVIDGTRCSPDGQSVCVNGRCLPIGCDQRIGSGKKADMCGVCGGHNDTCVHYRSSFTAATLSRQGGWRRRLQHGMPQGREKGGIYQEIAFVPAGSTNLHVQDKSKNLLALKTKGGSYEVKGLSGEYRVAGTTVRYDRSQEIDTLVAKGPTNEDMHIVAVLVDRHPSITYEYWVSKEKLPLLRASHHSSLSTSTSADSPPPSSGQSQSSGRTSIYFRGTGGSTSAPRSTTSKPSHSIFNWHHQRPPSHHVSASTRIPATDSSWTTRPPVQEVFFPQQDHSKEILNEGQVFQLVEGGDTFSWKPKQRSDSSPNSQKTLSWLSTPSSVVYAPPSSNANRREETKPKWRGQSTPSSIRHVKLSNEIPISDNNTLWAYKWKQGNGGSSSGSAAPRKKIVPTPVSIFVLPPPKSGPESKDADENRKYHKKKPQKVPTKEHCKPCKKVHNQLESYCNSDFVLRAEIVSFEYKNGETRYEIKVIQSYKNTVAILYKEYLWSPDTCRCPKLRVGREYILMGRSDRNFRKNESRLLVDRTCFVRRYSQRRSKGLMRLRREADKKCNRIS